MGSHDFDNVVNSLSYVMKQIKTNLNNKITCWETVNSEPVSGGANNNITVTIDTNDKSKRKQTNNNYNKVQKLLLY